MRDLKKCQRMRAAMENQVASRPPKPVEVVSNKPQSVAPKSSERRAVGAIAFKPPVEERKMAPLVPAGKGKGLLEEGVVSSVKKTAKYSCGCPQMPIFLQALWWKLCLLRSWTKTNLQRSRD
ncbi:hypothetical protein TSUD_159640 [Trifolium subterraneum]|uniref:Uncharacterized protein n=1 Tax=Trifolium subterraneum TaxID=3900 RepID=A0A2Z6MUQ6_TRISU|nr:hypothetical protein TSUD_159640 [Trifolium subterraneum]